MRIFRYCRIGLMLLLAAGCYEEEQLMPETEPELIYGKYTLPQGDHDYDPEIAEMYKKYNTLVLYKFEDKDYWWVVTRDIRWYYNEEQGTVGGYEAAPADENYVGQQLDLLKAKFLNYFPDTLLRRTLPLKILLTRYFNFVPSSLNTYPTDEDRQMRNVYWGYDYIGVNWGNENILRMTPAERNQFKIDICKTFLQQSSERTMGWDIVFFTISSYASGTSKTLANGFLPEADGISPVSDWKSYLAAIVSTPYEEMIAEGGILHSSMDVNGKVRQKYDIMINFFKTTYNIDLQAIGNDVEE